VPSGGRYRATHADFWERSDFLRLPPHARYVLLALMTGSTSSFPGIGIVSLEALVRQTGLSAAEVEGALGALEKSPTPNTSWIVRAGPIIWVRYQLERDPSVKDPIEGPNSAQRAGIWTHINSLPSDNAAVKKFKAYYKFKSRTVPPTVPTKVSLTVSPTVRGEKEQEPDQEQEKGTGTGKGLTTSWSTDVDRVGVGSLEPVSNGTNNGHQGTQRLQDAPAEWFNKCGEGNRRQCVKTDYLRLVDLPVQCDAHEKVRKQLAGVGR